MKKPNVQRHHISYDPEEVVKIYRGEHRILTLLNRSTKNFSVGFMRCLINWLVDHWDDAVDLDK